VREGLIGQSKPHPFSAKIEIDAIPDYIDHLFKDGYVGAGVAGSVWDFRPDLILEAQIWADRNNAAAYYGYGRRLAEQGQTFLADLIHQGSLKDSNDAHRALLGNYEELATHLIQWRHGFVQSLQTVEPLPITELQFLLHHPINRFLESIDLVCQSLASILDVFREWSGLEGLRKLSLWMEFPMDFGAIDTLWPRLHALTHLYIVGPSLGVDRERFSLGNIDLPSLIHFARQSEALSRTELKQIANASWPKLEALTLGIGFESATTVKDLVPIFAGENLPVLNKLAIRHCNIADALIPMLAKSRLLPQLEQLDFFQSNLTPMGAEQLLKFHKEFSHLTQIGIRETCLSKDDQQRLVAVLPGIGSYNPFRAKDELPYINANYQEHFWEEKAIV
jgi:hypothetical protein